MVLLNSMMPFEGRVNGVQFDAEDEVGVGWWAWSQKARTSMVRRWERNSRRNSRGATVTRL